MRTLKGSRNDPWCRLVWKPSAGVLKQESSSGQEGKLNPPPLPCLGPACLPSMRFHRAEPLHQAKQYSPLSNPPLLYSQLIAALIFTPAEGWALGRISSLLLNHPSLPPRALSGPSPTSSFPYHQPPWPTVQTDEWLTIARRPWNPAPGHHTLLACRSQSLGSAALPETCCHLSEAVESPTQLSPSGWGPWSQGTQKGCLTPALGTLSP